MIVTRLTVIQGRELSHLPALLTLHQVNCSNFSVAVAAAFSVAMFVPRPASPVRAASKNNNAHMSVFLSTCKRSLVQEPQFYVLI
jgi:hypothetical protein